MTDVPDIAPRTEQTKLVLRGSLLADRRARTAEALTVARARVADVVLSRSAERRWACVAGYAPMRTEPGSLPLLQRLVDAGVQVLVPHTLPDRDLDWFFWTGTDAAAGTPALLGPDAIARADAVLVPALAAASDGTRLGRGGGSYDRALPRCRPGAERIALLFDGEVVPWLPADPWDVAVTAAVMPSGYVPLWNTAVARDR